MTETRTRVQKQRAEKLAASGRAFDITISRTIGSVVKGEGGDAPLNVAMNIIAESGEEGDFQFTMPRAMSPSGEDLTVDISIHYTPHSPENGS